jgi:hypothetical protein
VHTFPLLDAVAASLVAPGVNIFYRFQTARTSSWISRPNSTDALAAGSLPRLFRVYQSRIAGRTLGLDRTHVVDINEDVTTFSAASYHSNKRNFLVIP